VRNSLSAQSVMFSRRLEPRAPGAFYLDGFEADGDDLADEANGAFGVVGRNFRSRFCNFARSRASHSQTVRTNQLRLNFRRLRLSRSTLLIRFFSQKPALVLGVTLPYLHLCMCQKQP